MSQEIFVQLVDFKIESVKEAVTPNSDGSYTVFINARLTKEEQESAYKHALKHINNDDFTKEDVQDIEVKAHTDIASEFFTDTLIALARSICYS